MKKEEKKETLRKKLKRLLKKPKKGRSKRSQGRSVKEEAKEAMEDAGGKKQQKEKRRYTVAHQNLNLNFSTKRLKTHEVILDTQPLRR